MLFFSTIFIALWLFSLSSAVCENLTKDDTGLKELDCYELKCVGELTAGEADLAKCTVHPHVTPYDQIALLFFA